jgi:hypothetical protein
MHGKQAQRGRLHRIPLLINLVEGAHPPPPTATRWTASYIRTRPPLLPPRHMQAHRPPFSAPTCQLDERQPLAARGTVLAERAPSTAAGRSQPRIFLRRGRSICLSSEPWDGTATGGGRRQNQVVYRSSQDPHFWLSICPNLSPVIFPTADSSTLPQPNCFCCVLFLAAAY